MLLQTMSTPVKLRRIISPIFSLQANLSINQSPPKKKQLKILKWHFMSSTPGITANNMNPIKIISSFSSPFSTKNTWGKKSDVNVNMLFHLKCCKIESFSGFQLHLTGEFLCVRGHSSSVLKLLFICIQIVRIVIQALVHYRIYEVERPHESANKDI